MRMFSASLVPLVVGFLLLECARDKRPSQDPPLGTYQYTGFDKNGTKIVTGELRITAREGNKIRGEWRLRQIGKPEKIGPQIGTGALEGEIADQQIRINLNPQMADNNVDLTGKVAAALIVGTWSYSGFAGEINHGSFEARRK